jgi:hypothetical protein
VTIANWQQPQLDVSERLDALAIAEEALRHAQDQNEALRVALKDERAAHVRDVQELKDLHLDALRDRDVYRAKDRIQEERIAWLEESLRCDRR